MRKMLRWESEATKPVWWPPDVPWHNVRCDTRSAVAKKEKTWTDALRSIFRACYQHHKCEHLLDAPTDVQQAKILPSVPKRQCACR